MKFRNYLPTEKYTLVTHLRVAEVRQRVADRIEPKTTTLFPMYSKKGRTKPYEGELVNDTFTINKIIDYKNSFLPVITGHISAHGDKTRIAISMNLTLFVLVFIAIWLGILGTICLGLLLSGLLRLSQFTQSEFNPLVLLPFGMFIFGAGLTLIAFKAESKSAKKFLADLLEGQELN